MFKKTAHLIHKLLNANKQTKRYNSNCWSCNKQLTKLEAKAFTCPCEKNVILPVNETNNYFDLFKISMEYNVDKIELTKRFRMLMRKLHPDLFTLKSQLERKYSLDQSSMVNKSYRVLTNPISRAIYLLGLNNVDYERESMNKIGDELNSDKNKILMHVLELNEELDEIESSRQVELLEQKLIKLISPLEIEFEQAYQAKNFNLAVKVLAKMKYYKSVDDRLQDLKLKFNLTNE